VHHQYCCYNGTGVIDYPIRHDERAQQKCRWKIARADLIMILTWMHMLPDLWILAITVSILTGVMMLAPQAGRHLAGFSPNKLRDEAAFDGFKAVMSMVGVVLAFSLVQANNNLRGVEAAVGREAAAFTAVDRALLRIGKPELASLRQDLAKYGNALVTEEWPVLNVGQRSATADDLFAGLARQVQSTSPADTRQQSIYNELLRNLDDLSDLREARLLAADDGLPEFFWVTICGLLLLGFALAALTENSLNRTVGIAGTATAVALLLAFLFIVDLPFDGETSVGPGPIQKAIIANAKRI